MTNIQTLLLRYLDYLEIEKNHSIKTRQAYERYLRHFIKSAKITSLDDITEEAVRTFRLTLARVKNPAGNLIKKNTQAYYAIAIRNFLKYLIKHGHSVLSPETIELPKIATRQLQILEYKDLERLLAAPKGSDIRSLRDKAVLEMLFSTGLRISELCSLSRYLNFDRGELTIRGKGEKLRIVFLSDTARQALHAYLDKRGDTHEALFVSLTRSGKSLSRITPRAVQRLVSFYARKAGIAGQKITPHSLRHQFATDLLMNGADLRSVQELLGHRNITTTQIYTHLTNKALREIHKAFHGKRRG